jgi:hypothetical protein
VHPFRAAWETRDLDAWVAALAPDVVLHSPVVTAPFRGREAAAELYGILFEEFGEVELTHELGEGDTHAFFWLAELGGRRIEGTDLLHTNERGEIDQVTVLIRPLVDIGLFAGEVGPKLARRRGPVQALVLTLLTLPLRGLLALADLVAPRLTQRR